VQAVGSLTLLRNPSAPSVAAGIGIGAVVGVLLAYDPMIGLAAVFAVVYATLAMFNLPLAVGLWVLAGLDPSAMATLALTAPLHPGA
jgi:uncharacterized protein (DUF2062 family)